jgi:hypothetical protein
MLLKLSFRGSLDLKPRSCSKGMGSSHCRLEEAVMKLAPECSLTPSHGLFIVIRIACHSIPTYLVGYPYATSEQLSTGQRSARKSTHPPKQRQLLQTLMLAFVVPLLSGANPGCSSQPSTDRLTLEIDQCQQAGEQGSLSPDTQRPTQRAANRRNVADVASSRESNSKNSLFCMPG